jgi:hypothetical protein
LQHGHLLRRPLDLALARIGKRDILYVAFLEFCRSHSWTPRDLNLHLGAVGCIWNYLPLKTIYLRQRKNLLSVDERRAGN